MASRRCRRLELGGRANVREAGGARGRFGAGTAAPCPTEAVAALDPANASMTDHIRIIKHEAVPNCGSFEVKFPDGRPSIYFYWDDLLSRRLRPDILSREQALEQARALARAERDRSY
jgi:hypothetical protein